MNDIIDGKEFDAFAQRLKGAAIDCIKAEVTLAEHYFHLGDIYIEGRKRYGQSVTQALPEIERINSVIRTASWVAAKVPKENRDIFLSWTHYRAVAGLPAEEQRPLLEKARDEHMSVSSLQSQVKAARKEPEPEPEEVPWEGLKEEPIRLPEVLAAARKVDCLIDSPYCVGSPTVPCHSNWSEDGKGRALKAHDLFVVPGCSDCHRWLDEGPDSKEIKRDVWHRAYKRFIERMWRDGVIGVLK